MRLAVLLRRLADARLLKDAPDDAGAQFPKDILSRTIDHLADDSREVGPEGLFVAIRGEDADGHVFIDKAVQHGAVAVLCEEVPGGAAARFPGVAFVRATDTRAALAEAAALFYGDPSRELRLVGVTGTNGKTTTAYLVRHALRALGQKAALIGTVETDLGEGPTASALTTPGALQLQQMLRTAAENGCTAGAMEVSSHALVQERVRATRFAAAVFTNLTPEHLDYHGSMEAYRDAKKRLFDALPAGATALYNADDPAGEEVVAGTDAEKVSFGSEADIRVEIVENRLGGLRLRLDGAERAFRLTGRFNALNLAAAYGAVRALGFGKEETLGALADAPPVPGRFEQLRFDDGRVVIVDYAHTPDALENVLCALRDVKEPGGVLWCVFGCGGDRDRTKRPAMGRLAERLADRAVVTSDNPRTEDPQAILDEIRGGMERPEEALFLEGRRAAIRAVARRSAPGDVILIAGKGHESHQTIGTEKRPFDDKKLASRYFQEET